MLARSTHAGSIRQLKRSMSLFPSAVSKAASLFRVIMLQQCQYLITLPHLFSYIQMTGCHQGSKR